MAARKNKTPAPIINYLRKAEVELADGRTVREVCKELGVTEHTYYRWRREYGGMTMDQAKRLKELEQENQRLRRAAKVQIDAVGGKPPESGPRRRRSRLRRSPCRSALRFGKLAAHQNRGIL
jgi:transposase-like protein